MVILKSSENKEAAFAFIDTILDPENHAWASENILYNVPNDEAISLLPEELTEQYAHARRPSRGDAAGREHGRPR